MYKDININGVTMDLPSVTQITGQIDKSSALMYWAAKCAVDYIKDHKSEFDETSHSFDNICRDAVTAYKNDTSKDIGTEVHKHIENFIKNDVFNNDFKYSCDEAKNAFDAFYDWTELNEVEFIETEKTLISNEYGYAGTCDAIAIVNDTKYILDWKTSKSIYPEYGLQLAGYRIAEGNKLNTAVLRLDKETGDFEFRDLTNNIEQKEQAFLKLVDFFYLEKKRRLKNNIFVDKYWRK